MDDCPFIHIRTYCDKKFPKRLRSNIKRGKRKCPYKKKEDCSLYIESLTNLDKMDSEAVETSKNITSPPITNEK